MAAFALLFAVFALTHATVLDQSAVKAKRTVVGVRKYLIIYYKRELRA